MKKYLLVFFTVALLAFMLASCVPQDHAPIVTFVNPTGVNVKTPANNGVYGPGTYTFAWSVTDVDKKDTVTATFTLTHNGTNVAVTVKDNTAVVTLTDAGTYTATVSAKDSKGLVSSQSIDFTIATDSNIEFTGSNLFGFEYINLTWKAKDGSPHIYQYKLDDADWTIASTSATSVGALQFIPKSAGGTISDGTHYLYVRIADQNVNLATEPVAVFPFVVDTTPPTVHYINSNRNYVMAHTGSSDANPEGRYALIQFGTIPGLTNIAKVKIRFYVYNNSSTANDGSIESGRVRLALGGYENGMYTKWVTEDASGNAFTSATQPWFDWDPYYVNKYGSDYILFNDGDVVLWGTGGKVVAHDLFKLNTEYAMWVDMIDEAGNEGGALVTFSLRERYDSAGKPVVYIETNTATTTKDHALNFIVNSKNIAQYCNQASHSGYDSTYDTTTNDGLAYVQIPVIVSSAVPIATNDVNVTLPASSILDAKNFAAYNVTQLSTNVVLVELYRGYVGNTIGNDATDVLANISITPTTDSTNVVYKAAIGYEGIFAYYPQYKGHLPNPIFRDNHNRLIDGIDTFDTPTAMVVVNPSESK